MVYLQVVLGLILSVILKNAVESWMTKRRLQDLMDRKHCQEPLTVGGKNYWQRFQRLRRIINIKKTGEDIIDDILAEDLRDASTVKSTTLDGSRLILTTEPSNLQAMLATQFKEFETGRMRFLQMGPLLGKSIFTSDGSFWEHSRALFRPQFSRENINDLEATEEAVAELVLAIGPIGAGGWSREVDLQPLFFNFTLDTASEFLFGESVKSQQQAIRSARGGGGDLEPVDLHSTAGQGSSKQFRDDLELIGDYILYRIRLSKLVRLGDGLEFRRALGRVKRFTEYFVQRALEGSKHGEDRTILFAGRDTTASLLGWCFVRLALHKDIYGNLRDVILKDFAQSESMTFAQLKSCRYLQHFLNEVLRLHPTVPLNQRTAACDTTLPVGGGPDGKSPVAVLKGDPVGFSVYLMHRRKDLWGSDALEFKPERWEKKYPNWQFLPFSGGPRICIGQQFALTEVGFVIVRLLQRFEALEPVDRAETLNMRKGLGLTMWPADGLKVRFRKAH
ncbi:cytochrome P450 [Hortaea werneckii]|nr:cytochrome P450 [Hortaea werneckii]KAI6983559.1 cytochrome P450 [Hortaea werneckii]KAI7166717.1 cytochrome P450 [Hortaea werneckii]KAI7589607.1 cytochrome P450 [Hortaea werneckii]KAI7666182.1 cytochrome P450 [Hortaea werneckii]